MRCAGGEEGAAEDDEPEVEADAEQGTPAPDDDDDAEDDAAEEDVEAEGTPAAAEPEGTPATEAPASAALKEAPPPLPAEVVLERPADAPPVVAPTDALGDRSCSALQMLRVFHPLGIVHESTSGRPSQGMTDLDKVLSTYRNHCLASPLWPLSNTVMCQANL